jgi:hypothetical protein
LVREVPLIIGGPAEILGRDDAERANAREHLCLRSAQVIFAVAKSDRFASLPARQPQVPSESGVPIDASTTPRLWLLLRPTRGMIVSSAPRHR